MVYKLLLEGLPYRCDVLDSPAKGITGTSQKKKCRQLSKEKMVSSETPSIADRL
jgi:hypothetical protein